MTLYDDLGVPPTASQDELHEAFKQAAMRTHPDTGGDAADFRKVTSAWAVLRDPAKRENYDRTGDTDTSPENPAHVALLCTIVDKLLEQIVDLSDCRELLEVTRSRLLYRAAQIEKQANSTRADCARIQLMLNKFVRTDSGPNFINNMVKSKLDTATKTLAIISKDMEITDKALELLSKFTFEESTNGI